MTRSTHNLRSFAGIPRRVMESADYRALSGSAVKLLLELAYQVRKRPVGLNNGDLTCAYSVLKNRGWRSRATLERARDELLKRRLIIVTRQGRFLNPGGVCSLYALTWLPIDEAPGKQLDVGPTKTPPRPAHEWE